MTKKELTKLRSINKMLYDSIYDVDLICGHVTCINNIEARKLIKEVKNLFKQSDRLNDLFIQLFGKYQGH
jgi:hypothetical protein